MNIYVVCTGNTCRSPMAEAIFRSYQLPNTMIQSAGIYALNGMPISSNAKHLITERNLPYTETSQQVTADHIEWAHYVFTMTEGHKMLLQQAFPNEKEKIFTLKEFVQDGEEIDIQDPFGGDLEMYRQTFNELSEVIEEVVGKLNE